MLLDSLIQIRPKPTPNQEITTPAIEDVFESALGSIFTDDLRVQHGYDGSQVIYSSPNHGDIILDLAEFKETTREGEDARKKFAHYVWNAGVLMGEVVAGRGGREELEGGWWLSEEEGRVWDVEGKKVIELGAGVGLGGIMSALSGASHVIITDYPSTPIHEAIATNIKANISSTTISAAKVTAEPHLWGDLDSSFAKENRHRFTRVLAADTLWLAGQHENLARSMLHFLSDQEDARVLVIAGFHTGREKVKHFFGETLDKVREGIYDPTVPDEIEGQDDDANGPVGQEAHVSSTNNEDIEDENPSGDRLVVENIFEMDADGRRRQWTWDEVPEEPIGERRKWLAVARLKRAKGDNSSA